MSDGTPWWTFPRLVSLSKENRPDVRMLSFARRCSDLRRLTSPRGRKMDPLNNINRRPNFTRPSAMLQQQQGEQAGFEQHLNELPQPGAANPSDAAYDRRFAYYHCFPQYKPSAADARLIEAMGHSASRELRPKTVSTRSSELRKLAHKLKETGEGLAMLDHNTLLTRARELFPADRSLITALNMLRQYRERPGEGTSRAGEGSARVPSEPAAHSPVQSFDQEELWDAADRGGPVPTSPMSPTVPWGQNLAAAIFGPTYHQLPSHQPVMNEAGPPLSAMAGETSEPIDVSDFVPKGFSHGTQVASADMRDQLWHLGLAPDLDQPKMSYIIRGERYTAELGLSNDVHLIHRPRGVQMNEAASSSVEPWAEAPEFGQFFIANPATSEQWAPMALMERLRETGFMPAPDRPTTIRLANQPYQAELGDGGFVRLTPLRRDTGGE
nr:hypothetical protein [Microvirga tunisiensis]